MFCTNCGKKLPDGASGPLCEACAASLASNSPSPAPAEKKTAAQLLKKSGTSAAKTAVKTGFKAKLVAAVAGVTAACAIVGFGANAIFGETKQEKIWNGMQDVLTLEDQYTIVDMVQGMGHELEAFSKEGGYGVSAQVTIPGEGSADLDLELKRNGKKNLLTLQGNLMGVSLEPSKLYFDGKQAAFDLLGADQFFSVKFEDLAKSLVASKEMTAEEAEKIWDNAVEVLTENAALYEDIREALEDCIDATIPQKLGEKDGKTEWSGDKYTAYSLRMDNDQAAQFLQDLGDAILADKTLRPWINDAVEAAQTQGEIPEDFDLNTAWAEAKSGIKTAQFFNGLKITAYFDGKTCVGFEGKVTNLLGERADLNFTVKHTPDEDGFYDRLMEVIYIDSRNREYGARYKGTWVGNAASCTEEGMLTIMDGGSNQVIPVRLSHDEHDEEMVDELTVQGVTLTRSVEGDPEGKQFTSTYECNVLGVSAQLELDYSKSNNKISTPKSTVLTDGSAEFFDQEALKELGNVIYDLQKTLGRLEDKLDF